MRLRLALAAVLLTCGLARAEADLGHIRPKPRPFAAVLIHPLPRPPLGPARIRPMPRPLVLAHAPTIAVPDDLAQMRPVKRPDFSKPMQKAVSSSLAGSVCQSPEIKGKDLPPMKARNKGCRVSEPVLVSEVSGVKLVPPATINCTEAKALSHWVTHGLQPAFDNAVVRLNVADSYACRPRNNVPGNPVSVHGLGQAIDIAGFKLSDGRTLTVASDYGRQMKAAQKAGCGTFHTILGPGSDGYHENHIHFDVASHGGGDYCR